MDSANFIKTVVQLKRDTAQSQAVSEDIAPIAEVDGDAIKESYVNIDKIKLIIQLRRDTTENWIINKDIIPVEGEPCFDINTKTLKIGDGVTTYENLPKIGYADVEDLQTSIDDMQFDVESIKTTLFPEGEESLEERVSVIETKMSEFAAIEIVEF